MVAASIGHGLFNRVDAKIRMPASNAPPYEAMAGLL
jgi:hypothetical protein